MKYKELELKRKELRIEYGITPTPKLLQLGTEYKELLDSSKGCYQCDEVMPKESESAFCSPKCKDAWNINNPRPQKRPSITEMRERLKQMAIEAKRRETLA